MNLLLIVDSYAPDTNNAASRMMAELAETLSELGNNVSVLAPTSNAEEAVTISQEGPYRVIRVRASATKNRGYFQRGLSELLLPFTLAKATRQLRSLTNRIDSIIWYAPTIFLGPLIWWFKFLFKCRTFLILRDVFPQWAEHAGILKPGPTLALLKLIARLQYRMADIIGIQAAGDKVFLPGGATQNKSVVLCNWASRTLPPPFDRPHPYEMETWFRNRKILVIGGALGPAQDPINVHRLASHLSSRDDVVILVLCDHPDPSFVEKCSTLPNNIVKILPGLPLDAYNMVLKSAYAGIISLNGDLKTHNIPGRFLSHLAAGLPTIASVNQNNELIALIEASNAGIAHANGDDLGLYKSIDRLLASPALRDAKAAAATRLSERFTPETAAKTVLNALQNL
jgi:O26-antigen biosynthesis N-acetyl-L-fucosamine transferase